MLTKLEQELRRVSISVFTAITQNILGTNCGPEFTQNIYGTNCGPELPLCNHVSAKKLFFNSGPQLVDFSLNLPLECVHVRYHEARSQLIEA